MMIQARAVHSQADAHRNELMTASGSRQAARRRVEPMSEPVAMRRPAGGPTGAGPTGAGRRSLRKSVAPRVGAWLIDFGTKLGGASVRTSS